MHERRSGTCIPRVQESVAVSWRMFLASMALLTAAFAASVRAQSGNEPIQPIARTNVARPQLAELGKKLYFDPRLSRSGFISCNSCHNLSMGGADNLKTSIGHNWQKGPINAPTVLNSSMNVAQFWDGRAPTLKAQAGGPIANPGEMAFTHELAVEMLSTIPGYVIDFQRAFGPGAIDIDKVTTAIAAFEETLVTPNSRFDRWLRGERRAINLEEEAGYVVFKSSGCTLCHNGPAAGGTSFRKMGVVEPYRTDNPSEGRVAVTGRDADRFNFKVPTLRNVELTYPYFHDGAADTLAEAVDVMGRIQLGKRYTPDELRKIVAFLKTLTGDQPSVTIPLLPPSSDTTPRPQPFK
jgi:cytochrome c peroxidase